MNNWAVEIAPFRIQFEYIKGIKNTLADTMSRLVNIDPATKDKPLGCEFGYYLFDPLPPIEVNEVSCTALPKIMVCDPKGHELVLLNPSKEDLKVQDLIDGLEGHHYEVVAELQALDPFCKCLIDNLKKGHLNPSDVYYLEGDTLKRHLTEDGKHRGTIVLPKVLIEPMMFKAHNMLGHNGTTRTYSLLRWLYFWKGMKNSITHYVCSCLTCQKRNQQVVRYAHSNFQVATFPMEFISMDLIGELYPSSKSRHKYALTVICMLMGYIFCVPLKSKSATEVVQAYIDHVYTKFGGSLQVLSDNGTEFKNQLFKQVTKELGVKYKKYTPPYCPASNGCIEGFHNFLKACICKHISSRLEWTDVVPLACAAYNFVPNEHSCESPFFLMFGRDPVLPLNSLLAPNYRYMGNYANLLSLDALKNMYQIVAENLRKARLCCLPLAHTTLSRTLQEGDLVLIKNHTAGPFDPKYGSPSRVLKVVGNQVELVPATGGKLRREHRKHVKYIPPAKKIISDMPEYERFGRKSKLRLAPSAIPDLGWEWTEDLHTQDIGLPTKVQNMKVPKPKSEELHTIYVESCNNLVKMYSEVRLVQSCGMLISTKSSLCMVEKLWHTCTSDSPEPLAKPLWAQALQADPERTASPIC